MCELMGLSFKRPLSADVSIRAFGTRGDENADGWGLAWYPDRAAAIVKEPVRWGESPMTRFLEAYPALRAPIFLAHVRHGTTGQAPCYADTHPFSREREGREYCFAHNGTIKGPIWELPTGRYRPLGATDSEQVFCHLLHEMDNRGGHLDDPDSWRFLHERLALVNRWGSLNMLFSDGVRLFCYHDLGAWKGLSFRSVDLGDRPCQHIGDATMDFDLKDPQANHGIVVATYPLDDAPWDRIEPGELVVLEAGTVRHSSHREVALQPRRQHAERVPLGKGPS
jgi:predicted glutamine amidotransferase